MKDAKAPKEVLASRAPAVKDPPLAPPPPPPKAAAAPGPGPAKAAPASTKGAPGSTKGTVPAGKAQAKAAAAPSAEKPGAERPAADKPPPVPGADKPAPPGRAIPPERRKALEDSVLTSAPKLPLDAAARAAAAARAPAKTAKTAPATPPKAAAERSADKDKDKTPTPATPEASAAPALRPRRDHSKSPGFYSSVSPQGANVVTNPFAPATPKKPTVVGIPAPPDPIKQAPPVRADLPPPAPIHIPDAGLDLLPGETGTVEFVPAAASPLGEMTQVPAEDGMAPPQPCSTPPGSVSPLAREEKEETSPGLGHARSVHDPNLSSQINGSDLELLLAFALDLALGCASSAWFVPLRAAVGRLLAGDAAIRSSALEKALTTLANDLEQPGAFNDENRQRLYGHVVAVDLALAKRMDVTGQKAIRERLIVDQLLDELAQANPMLTRRLRDQGLVSLENLGKLSPADLSVKLEAPEDTAAQVASIFQGYLEARVQRGPTVALLGKSVALKERLSALEASAEAFERASEGEDSGARRRTRKQRQTDVTQLNLLLAEFGEAKTLAEIERCSVQAKIERIQRWIGEQETGSGRRANKPSSPP